MADTRQAEVIAAGALAATGGPPVSAAERRTLRARWAAHWAQPFYRNAYSLMLHTGLTGGLGAAYWAVAATTYAEEDVGRGSATISLMTLLSGVVAFNLMGTLTRFIGDTGPRVVRFTAVVFGGTLVLVTALTQLFFLTRERWGPAYAHLDGNGIRWWFTGAVVVGALVALQDGVLVGLRRSTVVLALGAVFNVAKLVLLVALAASFPEDGVWLAWFAAMVVVTLPVSAVLFLRVLPAHGRAADPGRPLPTRVTVRRFAAADYGGALCVFATVQLVPVLVAATVPVASFGWFFIAWTLSTMLNLVAVGVAISLTVEGVYDAGSIAANCRAAVRRVLALLVPVVVVLLVAAPVALGWLGAGYASAAPLLQLLGLAALPRAMTEIWVGVLRAHGAGRRIIALQAVRAVLVIGGIVAALDADAVWDWLGVHPLTGLGLTALGAELLVAAYVLPLLRGVVRTGEPTSEQVRPTAGPAPSSERHRWARRLPGALAWAATAAAVVLFVVPLRHVDATAVGGLGLVAALPPASLAGIALLAVTFVAVLCARRIRPALMTVQVVATVVCLHGLPAMLGGPPRFSTSWVHVGLLEYVTRTGSTAPTLDGRYSWPGFFTSWSWLTGADDRGDLAWVLHLTPVVSNLLYLVPFALVLRQLRADRRATWLALWSFGVLNWIGQDYFSPQGMAYLLHLTLLAVLITWCRPVDPASGRRSWRWVPLLRRWTARLTVSGEVPVQRAAPTELALLLGVVVVLFAALVGSHPLTPFMTVFTVAGLVLVGRCRFRGLPVLLAVILVGYLSFLTATYWSGNVDELIDGIGRVLANVSSGVSGRTAVPTPEHAIVLRVRTLLGVVVPLVALVGLLRRWRRGYDDRLALVLLVSPFAALALQSYGGEVALRVFFFALPGLCIFLGYAFFPGSTRAGRAPLRVAAALAACALVLVPSFLVARYGNQAFEAAREGELAAMDAVYGAGEGPLVVLWPADDPTGFPVPNMVHGYQDVERVAFRAVAAPKDPADVDPVLDELRDLGDGALLVTTRMEENRLEIAAGYPAGWGGRFDAELAGTPGVRVLSSGPDAAVYALDSTDVDGGRAPARPPGPTVSPTPLTPLGWGCFALLVVLLAGRELRSLRPAPRSLARWTWAAVLPAAGLVVVLVERVLVLS